MTKMCQAERSGRREAWRRLDLAALLGVGAQMIQSGNGGLGGGPMGFAPGQGKPQQQHPQQQPGAMGFAPTQHPGQGQQAPMGFAPNPMTAPQGPFPGQQGQQPGFAVNPGQQPGFVANPAGPQQHQTGDGFGWAMPPK